MKLVVTIFLFLSLSITLKAQTITIPKSLDIRLKLLEQNKRELQDYLEIARGSRKGFLVYSDFGIYYLSEEKVISIITKTILRGGKNIKRGIRYIKYLKELNRSLESEIRKELKEVNNKIYFTKNQIAKRNRELENNTNTTGVLISVSGKWKADPGGVLTISQSGNKVVGSYNNGKSKINGTLNGYTLRGEFSYNNKVGGTFTLIFNKDGKSFSGSWKNTTGTSTSGGWHGTLIKD